MPNIADIRKEYSQQTLDEFKVTDNPLLQFEKWWGEAVESHIDEVNAMTLATADRNGSPSARTVLLKDFDKRGFVFFTNYDSRKSQHLMENPQGCLLFFWKELERQVRVEGLVEKISSEESDAYFASRPQGSKIGAWASPQSSTIVNREYLETEVDRLNKLYETEPIPRPPHWGGFRLNPQRIEFWQGRPSRLHDRILYSLLKPDEWKRERLAP